MNIGNLIKMILRKFGIKDANLYYMISYFYLLGLSTVENGHSIILGGSSMGKTFLYSIQEYYIVGKVTIARLLGAAKPTADKENIKKEKVILENKNILFEEVSNYDNSECYGELKRVFDAHCFQKHCREELKQEFNGRVAFIGNNRKEVNSLSEISATDIVDHLVGSDTNFLTKIPQIHYWSKNLVGEISFAKNVKTEEIKKEIKELREKKLPFNIKDTYDGNGREGELVSRNFEGVLKLLFPKATDKDDIFEELNLKIKNALIYLARCFYSIQNKKYLPLLSKESLPLFLEMVGVDIENDNLKTKVLNEHLFSVEDDNYITCYAFDEVGRKILKENYKIIQENKKDFLKVASYDNYRILKFEKDSNYIARSNVNFNQKTEMTLRLNYIEDNKKVIKEIERILINFLQDRLRKTNWINNCSNYPLQWNSTDIIANENFFLHYDNNKLIMISNEPFNYYQILHLCYPQNEICAKKITNVITNREETLMLYLSSLTRNMEKHIAPEIIVDIQKEIKKHLEFLDKDIELGEGIPYEVIELNKKKIEKKYEKKDFEAEYIDPETYDFKLTLITQSLPNTEL